MSVNVVSLISQFLTPDMIAKIASALGADKILVDKATGAAVSSLLGSLAGVAATQDGAQKLYPELRHPATCGQGAAMLTHGQIWVAIDAIAARYGLTASGLAKRAGLDPTTFNKSKRISPDGRLRWPSTESLAKVLDATGASLDEFMTLVGSTGPQPSSRTLPLLGVADAGHDGCFAPDGQPSGTRWDEIVFPGLPQQGVYAIEVSGDSMLPTFRKGDILVCSQTAPLRRGDRVVVKTKAGELVIKELKRRTAKTIELHSLNPQHADTALNSDIIAWIARVMWVSQ